MGSKAQFTAGGQEDAGRGSLGFLSSVERFGAPGTLPGCRLGIPLQGVSPRPRRTDGRRSQCAARTPGTLLQGRVLPIPAWAGRGECKFLLTAVCRSLHAGRAEAGPWGADAGRKT